jgi:hypothetical protein
MLQQSANLNTVYGPIAIKALALMLPQRNMLLSRCVLPLTRNDGLLQQRRGDSQQRADAQPLCSRIALPSNLFDKAALNSKHCTVP